MAEGFQNKKLLAIAIALGVLFLVLFNVQRIVEARQREARRTYVVRVLTDLEPNAVLTADNVRMVGLDVEPDSLKGLVMWGGETGLGRKLGVQQVRRGVEKNTLLQLADISSGGELSGGPSGDIRRGWRAIPLKVASDDTASAYLRRGDRVDVFAAISIDGQPARSQLIIESLEVMAVGDRIESTGGSNFRTVTVQVPADVVPDLVEVLERRVSSRPTIAVRNPDDKKIQYRHPSEMDGTILAEPVRRSLTRPFTPPRDLIFDDMP